MNALYYILYTLIAANVPNSKVNCFTPQTDYNNLYLLNEYCVGGEMYKHLRSSDYNRFHRHRLVWLKLKTRCGNHTLNAQKMTRWTQANATISMHMHNVAKGSSVRCTSSIGSRFLAFVGMYGTYLVPGPCTRATSVGLHARSQPISLVFMALATVVWSCGWRTRVIL